MRKADRVLLDGQDPFEGRRLAQGREHRGKGADADAGVSSFEPLDGLLRHGCSFGEVRHGEASDKAGSLEVPSEGQKGPLSAQA